MIKILLNIGTHGDEKIGEKVVEKIRKLNLNNIVFQVANEKALALNKRFIDQDLNRSFPGKADGNHEERIAYELSPIIKSSDIVIDIHSTTSNLRDAFIVTKLDEKTLEYVKVIRPKYVLVMNATKDNALISQANVGFAFEYGKDSSTVALNKIVVGIKRLLDHLNLVNFKKPYEGALTSYFDVISTVKKPTGYKLSKKIKNYKLLKKGSVYATKGKEKLVAEDDFYPILFGEKNYKDIFGFSAKSIDL